MLALTPPPDRAITVLWYNFIRKFNVPGGLDTVPSAHSRSLASVQFLPLKLARHYAYGQSEAARTGTRTGLSPPDLASDSGALDHSVTEGTYIVFE